MMLFSRRRYALAPPLIIAAATPILSIDAAVVIADATPRHAIF